VLPRQRQIVLVVFCRDSTKRIPNGLQI
jgi:hypothetical protein